MGLLGLGEGRTHLLAVVVEPGDLDRREHTGGAVLEPRTADAELPAASQDAIDQLVDGHGTFHSDG
ncbi:MAG: hypothetical protein ACLQBX_15595 [Candidatus Limnocylindrales bacterium]